MSQDKLRVYFPGLNALRFFAALAVIVSHIEMIFQRTGFNTYWYWLESRMQTNGLNTILKTDTKTFNYFISLAGYCGVIFFFVLSGFLITYLLLAEKENTGTISIRDFYLRRLLRIWPLYYFLVALGFFILPHIQLFHLGHETKYFMSSFGFNLFCYVFMIPNLAASYDIWHVPNIGHLWSIGVEEQFYLFWPLIIAFFLRTRRVIVIFIIALVAFKTFIFLVPVFSPGLTKFIGSMKFEAMAVGAFGACLIYYKKSEILRYIYAIPTQIMAYVLLFLILLLLPYQIFETLYLFLSVPFLIIIMNVASNKGSLLKLENKVFDYLGKISYGLYMYHLLVVTFVVNLYATSFETQYNITVYQRIAIYLISIILTIAISGLSYKYFEKRFITMKSKYSRVISGERAKEISDFEKS